MLEGVVHDGFQHQAVPDVGGATKMEHVDGPQGWMGITQAAAFREIQHKQMLGCVSRIGF